MSCLHPRLPALVLAAVVALDPAPGLAYTLTTFGQGIYDADTAAMDVALGITVVPLPPAVWLLGTAVASVAPRGRLRRRPAAKTSTN